MEPSPRLVIELLHNGEQLTVDEDDTEKANPSHLDLVEDIAHLNHLNEASVLHCLRQRYANNLIHTAAGPVLMVVNPMAPLSLYSEKVKARQILTNFVKATVVFNFFPVSYSRLFPCSADASPRICRRTSTPRHKMLIAL